MAINKKLKKTIISNKHANDVLNKNFNQLAKTENLLDFDAIKNIYNNVFYYVPKTGKESHKTLIEESYNHIYFNYNRQLDLKIKRLIKDLSRKEGELTSLENPESQEHPIYEDRAILIAGEGGMQYQDMDTKYIMQEGRKRAFSDDNIFFTTKKLLGIPLEDNDGRYFLTVDELNELPDAPEIAITDDLHVKGDDLVVDLGDIMGSSAYYEVEFECLGNEVSDYVGALSDNMLDLDVETFQFYMGNDACTIKYIKDEYTNDELGPKVHEVSIPKGETKTLKILRRTGMENDLIPENLGPYYSITPAISIEYNGNDITNYERNWGPYGDYESIVYAEGRIMSTEKESAHIANAMMQMGEIQDTSRKLFNGLGTTQTGAWGEADIVVIEDPNYTGQELSVYGTKMIYNIPGAYGNLGQSNDLQEKVFSNPSHPYYAAKYYGQPIFRYENSYLMLNKTYKSWGKRFSFYDLGAFPVREITKHHSNVSIMDLDLSGNDILGVRWDTLDKSRIRFPGLQEYKTREQNIDDNIFNPAQGSNYELNQYNSWS